MFERDPKRPKSSEQTKQKINGQQKMKKKNIHVNAYRLVVCLVHERTNQRNDIK